MTNDVGAALKAARERLGLTLEEAETATRIRYRFLQALEENDQSILGGDIYVRGFLKNYASFLGLDASELLPPAQSSVPIITPPPPQEAEMLSLPLRDTSFPFGRILLMLLAFALLGIVAFFAWQPAQRAILFEWFGAYLPMPTPTSLAVAGGGPGVAVTVAEPTATVPQMAAANSTPTSTPVPTATLPPRTPTPDLTATARPTETPEPSPTFAPADGIVVNVRVIAPSWTQVYLDNDEFPVMERTLTEGETFEWIGQERVFLRLGNAGGVIVTLNGRELGVLGEAGAVIDRTWVLDPASGQPVESTNTD